MSQQPDKKAGSGSARVSVRSGKIISDAGKRHSAALTRLANR